MTTIGVMHVFKAAQPALLYLSPAFIISITLCATIRGEFSQMWNWEDGAEDEEKEEEDTIETSREDSHGESTAIEVKESIRKR